MSQNPEIGAFKLKKDNLTFLHPLPSAPQIIAAVFLALYGVGLPLALLAVVLGARKFKSEGDTSGISLSDEGQASSTCRSLGLPLTNSSEVDNTAAVTSSATVSGEEGEEGDEEDEETSGMTEKAWREPSDALSGSGRPRLRAGAEEGSRAKSASVSTIVTNTTVATTSSRNGCSSRAWKTSGRCVVAVRKAMTSRVDPWTVSESTLRFSFLVFVFILPADGKSKASAHHTSTRGDIG